MPPRFPSQGRRARIGRAALICGFAAALLVGAPRPAEAAESAVILMYHRFGETAYPSTNIRLEQFEAHLRKLASDGYTVLPVPKILRAIKAGTPLPNLTVGITVDDAYLSVYTEAWPRLKAAGFPVTVFVATDAVDKGYSDYMSWDQIRELAAAGVTIGSHGAVHGHLADDADAFAADLAHATARFRAELGTVPELFAYPYGEVSLAVQEKVVAAGFKAAFGQQSGAVYSGDDVFDLPRFALDEAYGTPSQFRLRVRALPLPVQDVTPVDPLLSANPPAFGFTVAAGLGGLNRLRCYTSGQGAARLERLGARRIEVRLAKPFPPGRTRINCTLPGPDGRWRWFGSLFYVPKK